MLEYDVGEVPDHLQERAAELDPELEAVGRADRLHAFM